MTKEYKCEKTELIREFFQDRDTRSLAEKLDVTMQAIRNFKKGKAKFLSCENFMKACKLLHEEARKIQAKL